MYFVFPFYFLVTSGYLAVTWSYLIVTSGYLIAITGYFWLLLVTSRYVLLLLVPRFNDNVYKVYKVIEFIKKDC